MRQHWVGWAVALLWACGEDARPAGPTAPGAPVSRDDAGAGTEQVRYQRDVAPIFAVACLGCHHADSPTKLDLTRPFDPVIGLVNRPNSWTNARNTVLVVPGAPERSALMDKIAADDLDPKREGAAMPLSLPALTDAELQSLRQWIDDGAKDDQRYRDEVTLIFGDGVSLGRSAGKCAWCHFPGTPTPPDLTQPFDPQAGAVNVAATTGGTRVVPGDADASVLMRRVDPSLEPVGRAMPLQIPPLSDAQIQVIRRWIAQGARDD